MFLSVERKMLRISRDWVGGQWVDIEPNPEILSILSAAMSLESKLSVSSAITKEVKSDGSPASCHKVPSDIKLSVVYESQQKDWANSYRQPVDDEDGENAAKPVDDSDLTINTDCHLPESNQIEKSNNTDDDKDDETDEGSDEEEKSTEFETAGQQSEVEATATATTT